MNSGSCGRSYPSLRYCCIIRNMQPWVWWGSLLWTKLIKQVLWRSKPALKTDYEPESQSETWLAGHLPIVRLRRAARHLRVEVKLGGVRHWLDDGTFAAIAKGCGEWPRHLVYGCARCKRVLGLTRCRCEWILSVEKDSAKATPCMSDHAHTHTHTYTWFHKH